MQLNNSQNVPTRREVPERAFAVRALNALAHSEVAPDYATSVVGDLARIDQSTYLVKEAAEIAGIEICFGALKQLRVMCAHTIFLRETIARVILDDVRSGEYLGGFLEDPMSADFPIAASIIAQIRRPKDSELSPQMSQLGSRVIAALEVGTRLVPEGPYFGGALGYLSLGLARMEHPSADYGIALALSWRSTGGRPERENSILAAASLQPGTACDVIDPLVGIAFDADARDDERVLSVLALAGLRCNEALTDLELLHPFDNEVLHEAVHWARMRLQGEMPSSDAFVEAIESSPLKDRLRCLVERAGLRRVPSPLMKIRESLLSDLVISGDADAIASTERRAVQAVRSENYADYPALDRARGLFLHLRSDQGLIDPDRFKRIVVSLYDVHYDSVAHAAVEWLVENLQKGHPPTGYRASCEFVHLCKILGPVTSPLDGHLVQFIEMSGTVEVYKIVEALSCMGSESQQKLVDLSHHTNTLVRRSAFLKLLELPVTTVDIPSLCREKAFDSDLRIRDTARYHFWISHGDGIVGNAKALLALMKLEYDHARRRPPP